MSLDIAVVSRPDTGDDVQDEAPTVETTTGDYDSRYPGSTEDAPFGFKPDGTPYKRHHSGHGKDKKTGISSTRNEANAKAAAALLAHLNLMIVMALHTGNLSKTATAIEEGNAQFQAMAYNSLLQDPALCRKILGAGAASGKTGLIMAYAFLGVSAVPAIRLEIQERKAMADE